MTAEALVDVPQVEPWESDPNRAIPALEMARICALARVDELMGLHTELLGLGLPGLAAAGLTKARAEYLAGELPEMVEPERDPVTRKIPMVGRKFSGWEVLEELQQGRCTVQCVKCGAEAVRPGYNLRAGRVGRCRSCSNKLQQKPTLCTSCGTTSAALFGRYRSMCMACRGRKRANGSCPTCGFSLSQKVPCQCGLLAGDLGLTNGGV